jgi:chromosome segregation protein
MPRREVRDAATSSCDTAMQAVLADLREVEAQIERIRADQVSKADASSAIQTRFYEAGAEVTRIEQGIQFARELRQRQRSDLDGAEVQVADLTSVLQRDRGQLEALSQELATMVPGLDAAHGQELGTAQALESCETALAAWQQTWEAHSQAVAQAQRETGVERAHIEQLESQQRRLLQQRERQESERALLAQIEPAVALETLEQRAGAARDAGQKAAGELQELLAEISVAREREREQSQSLNALRTRWQESLGSQVSTEALQHAALGKVSGKVTEWLKSKSLDRQPRVAQQLRVDRGWERAVETVLGSYLEAVCVDGLDSVTDLLSSFDGGHLAVVSMTESGAGLPAAVPRDAASLQAKVQGTSVLSSLLSSVYTAETLGEALAMRRRLAAGNSVVTRDGIWLGSDWLRLSRDADPHTGVIEREESLREIRVQVSGLADEVKQLEHRLELAREHVRDLEDRRDSFQAEVNRLHREHVDRRAEFDSAQARNVDAARRLSQLETGLADVRTELERTETDLRAARGRMETAIDTLAALEPQRIDLEEQRDRMRAEVAAARATALGAQQLARELALQVESRRSSHSSLTTALSRIEAQLDGFGGAAQRTGEAVGGGRGAAGRSADPARAGIARARGNRGRAAGGARIVSDELDTELRERDAGRSGLEQRVEASRV